MEHDDFIALIETYGANPLRWPAQKRANAETFMAASPELAQPLLEQAQQLDSIIEAARIEPGTDILKARILNALPSQDEEIHEPMPMKSTRRFGYGSMVAMMALSFVFGIAGTNMAGMTFIDDAQTIQLAQSEWEALAEEFEMDEIYEWVGVNPVN